MPKIVRLKLNLPVRLEAVINSAAADPAERGRLPRKADAAKIKVVNANQSMNPWFDVAPPTEGNVRTSALEKLTRRRFREWPEQIQRGVTFDA